MHWIGIALLALGVGYLYTLWFSKIMAKVPGSNSKIAAAFFTGFILLAFVFLVSLVLDLLPGGLSPSRS